MKRAREVNDEMEEASGVEVVNWCRVFEIEAILMVLNPYISTRDLIRLSRVNKHMYTTWITNERRLGVLRMRERVKDVTNRVYKKNPLFFIRSASLKACSPIIGNQGKFKCWRCNHYRHVCDLADSRIFKLHTCFNCAKVRIDKTHVLFANLYWTIWRFAKHLPKPCSDGRKWLGGNFDFQLLKRVTPHIVTFKRSPFDTGKDYVPNNVVYWVIHRVKKYKIVS